MTGTAQRAANLTTSTNHHVAKEPPKPSSRRWIGRLKVNKPGNRVGVLMASVLTMSILGGCALTVLQEYRLHEFCSNRGSKQFERDYIVDVVRFCKPEPSSFEFSTYQSLNSANQSSLLKSLARISGLRVASNMFDLREAGERHSERGVDAARELVTSNRNDFILFCSALAAVAGLFAYIIGLFLGWAWLGAQRQT